MQTNDIEELLEHFSDAQLAKLQKAAEDGRLVYESCKECFVHYLHEMYSFTKNLSSVAELAERAERQFRNLPESTSEWVDVDRANIMRCRLMLPLIRAAWAQRAMPLPAPRQSVAVLQGR